MTNETTNPGWDEYQDISNTLSQLLNKGYTKPMIQTVLEQMREAKMTNEMAAEEAVKILKYERDNDIFVSTAYRENLHEALTKAIQALEQQQGKEDFIKHEKTCEDRISNCIKQKIDYLEELASIENNEGRWVEAEKYYYTSSALEEILEYMKAREIEDGDSN